MNATETKLAPQGDAGGATSSIAGRSASPGAAPPHPAAPPPNASVTKTASTFGPAATYRLASRVRGGVDPPGPRIVGLGVFEAVVGSEHEPGPDDVGPAGRRPHAVHAVAGLRHALDGRQMARGVRPDGGRAPVRRRRHVHNGGRERGTDAGYMSYVQACCRTL